MPSVHVALHRFRPCAPDREHFEIRSNGSERSQQVLFIRKLWTCRVRADRHWSVLTKSNISAVPSYKNVHYSARHLSRSHGLWPSNFSVKTLINLLLNKLSCFYVIIYRVLKKNKKDWSRWTGGKMRENGVCALLFWHRGSSITRKWLSCLVCA